MAGKGQEITILEDDSEDDNQVILVDPAIRSDKMRKRKRSHHHADHPGIDQQQSGCIDLTATSTSGSSSVTSRRERRRNRLHFSNGSRSGASSAGQQEDITILEVDPAFARQEVTVLDVDDDFRDRASRAGVLPTQSCTSSSFDLTSASIPLDGNRFQHMNLSLNPDPDPDPDAPLNQRQAIRKIQELFPNMDPVHIIGHLPQSSSPYVQDITPQQIENLIQLLLSEPKYPKIQQVHSTAIAQMKEIDYANDDYERSDTYKIEAYHKLLMNFPFVSVNGMKTMFQGCQKKYYKTYMFIVEHMKQTHQGMTSSASGGDNSSNAMEQYQEVMRLMSGGRMSQRARERFNKSILDEMKKNHSDIAIPSNITLQNRRAKHTPVPIITDDTLLLEQNYTKAKIKSWYSTIRADVERKEARKKSERDGQCITCTCCFCDYAFEEMVACNDGHLFCIDCLRRYAEEKVFGNGDLGGKGESGTCTELKCMELGGCDSWFSREQLQRALTDKVLKKYDELQASLVLKQVGMEDLCVCPQCNFQASLPLSERVFQCPSCNYESCRECGEAAHIPLRCNEVEKKDETSARLKVEEAMTKAKVRICPRGCKQGFYKEDGCNKMTCPTCKVYICYICRKEIDKHVGYKHFCQKPHCNHKSCKKCPLWSNAKEDDERAARDAGLKTAQELKQKSEKGDELTKKLEDTLLRDGDDAAALNTVHAQGDRGPIPGAGLGLGAPGAAGGGWRGGAQGNPNIHANGGLLGAPGGLVWGGHGQNGHLDGAVAWAAQFNDIMDIANGYNPPNGPPGGWGGYNNFPPPRIVRRRRW